MSEAPRTAEPAGLSKTFVAAIRSAIKAAKECGVTIGVVDVMQDGPRILATLPEASPCFAGKEENSCAGLHGDIASEHFRDLATSTHRETCASTPSR